MQARGPRHPSGRALQQIRRQDRGRDGRLYEAPGTWRDRTGAALEPPPPLATARTEPTGGVVDAEGEVEPVGR